MLELTKEQIQQLVDTIESKQDCHCSVSNSMRTIWITSSDGENELRVAFLGNFALVLSRVEFAHKRCGTMTAILFCLKENLRRKRRTPHYYPICVDARNGVILLQIWLQARPKLDHGSWWSLDGRLFLRFLAGVSGCSIFLCFHEPPVLLKEQICFGSSYLAGIANSYSASFRVFPGQHFRDVGDIESLARVPDDCLRR